MTNTFQIIIIGTYLNFKVITYGRQNYSHSLQKGLRPEFFK